MKQSLKLLVLIMHVEFSQHGICNYAVIKLIVNIWTIHLKEYIKTTTVLKINALRIAMFKEEEEEITLIKTRSWAHKWRKKKS